MRVSQTDLKIQPPSIPERQQKTLTVMHTSDVEAVGNEIYDAECLKLINEYFFGKHAFVHRIRNVTYFVRCSSFSRTRPHTYLRRMGNHTVSFTHQRL